MNINAVLNIQYYEVSFWIVYLEMIDLHTQRGLYLEAVTLKVFKSIYKRTSIVKKY